MNEAQGGSERMDDERPRLWWPNLIVFVSSACMMVLELVISRLVAPYVGASLYIWTAVIGVVLTGISLGNYLGGRLADRWASPRMLGGIFLLGGLASLNTLSVNVLKRFLDLERITREALPLIVGSAAFVVGVCFLPCLILGTISPVVARLAVHDLGRAGRTVGHLYAAGAAGSIVGTFATGFFLISRWGAHITAWGVGAILMAIGLFFLLKGHPAWMLASFVCLALGSLAASRLGWLRGPCTRETNYFCITVRDEEQSGKPVRVLILDRLIHSYSSMDDPTTLVYSYEQTYAGFTAYQAQQKGPLRALLIGGGGYTFPRYMEAVYPNSDLHVVEIDPGVTQVAYDLLGLSRDTRVVTFNQDARMLLAGEPTQSYDLVFGDAFNDYSVPYHLTTREFNERVRAWLANDGWYVVNIIDGPRGTFLRAYAHTLRQTFSYVYPVFSVESWRQSTRNTIVILSGNAPLDMAVLERTSPQLAAQLLSPQETDALLAQGRTVTLTDRYAPVDQMLLPVFLDQLPR